MAHGKKRLIEKLAEDREKREAAFSQQKVPIAVEEPLKIKFFKLRFRHWGGRSNSNQRVGAR